MVTMITRMRIVSSWLSLFWFFTIDTTAAFRLPNTIALRRLSPFDLHHYSSKSQHERTLTYTNENDTKDPIHNSTAKWWTTPAPRHDDRHAPPKDPQDDEQQNPSQLMTMMSTMMFASRQHAAVTMVSNMFARHQKSISAAAGAAATTQTTATTTTTMTNKHSVIAVATILRGGAAAAAAATASPKLIAWIGPALACATSYALYNLFIKKASSSIDPILGGVLLQFVAALIGTILLGLQTILAKGSAAATTTALQITKTGLLWSIAAGSAVGAAEILSFIISGMGVEATQSIPIIVGGSIVVGTILGAVWLRERLTLRGWLGVLLITAGIALVSMDPGSSMGGH